MRLQGKRALVTGGAAGIGLAIVERFLAEGAKVAFCDLNAEASRAAIAELSSHKGKVLSILGDVSNSAGAKKIVSEAVAFLGGLDILVNNAGTDLQRDLLQTTDEEWDKILRVNLGGVFYMARAAVPEMIKAGGGSIVNFGSIAAFLGFQNMAAYGAAKAGVVQLTRNLAGELAPHNIRVNSVNPGAVETPMFKAACKVVAGPGGDYEAVKTALVELQMLKRVAQPAEIANAVLFLASDEAGFITASALMADGGWSVRQ
jgi:NAD(P)-dependent dehydrogenase (short-subunit alcohol dehydrogenase family)